VDGSVLGLAVHVGPRPGGHLDLSFTGPGRGRGVFPRRVVAELGSAGSIHIEVDIGDLTPETLTLIAEIATEPVRRERILAPPRRRSKQYWCGAVRLAQAAGPVVWGGGGGV